MMSSVKRFFFSFSILLFTSSYILGQESFKEVKTISIAEADAIFLSKNLLLLAERYNVDAAKAQIIQAKLFNNITLNVSQNVYDPDRKLWFDASAKGETASSIQKLFLLAGKRNKLIKIAELSYNKEEQTYFDLIRTLKYSLRSDFYNIYFLNQTLSLYDKEISSLSKLIAVFEKQLEKGYVSKKEVLRLKSFLFSLESEKQGYSTQLISNLSDFNVLLHTSNINYLPRIEANNMNFIALDSIKLLSLIDTAAAHRYDLMMAQTDININKANLSYQQALATPDITLGAGWDRNGSFVHNFNFLSMQIDLPFFNRNQGNIKSARFNLENSKVKLMSTMDVVQSDVNQAYSNALSADRLYHKFDEPFVNDLDALVEEMVKNYEKKNIGIVEFLDYYDAYKNNIVQINNLRNNRANAYENLNFAIGRDIVNK
ncbi:MAG: TolC family protein [Bacteroidetes bacterium]|nr:TolC family protein [Bacteroidota bacterium]